MGISDLKKAIAQNQWRNYYLALIAISTNLITIYVLINPDAGNNDLANFKFPQQIKLDAGKLTAIFRKVGDMVAPGGYIIKAGYNTNPFHPCFDLVEVRMVYHGGTANDTVFSVWRKTNYTLWDWDEDKLKDIVEDDEE